MGMISDFFAATPEELGAFEPGKQPGLSMPMIWGRLVHLDQLRELHDIVRGRWSPENARIYDGYGTRMTGERIVDERAVAFLTGVKETMVISLCPCTVEGLAQADPDQLADFAAKWAQAEDWRQVDMTREDVLTLLEGIAGLARHAVSTDRELYVWLCRWPGDLEREGRAVRREREALRLLDCSGAGGQR